MARDFQAPAMTISSLLLVDLHHAGRPPQKRRADPAHAPEQEPGHCTPSWNHALLPYKRC
jgi:hypothetical protein